MEQHQNRRFPDSLLRIILLTNTQIYTKVPNYNWDTFVPTKLGTYVKLLQQERWWSFPLCNFLTPTLKLPTLNFLTQYSRSALQLEHCLLKLTLHATFTESLEKIIRWTSESCVRKFSRVVGCTSLPLSSLVTIFTARFNIHKLYVLPTHCIYVSCVDLRTNSDYFTVQN